MIFVSLLHMTLLHSHTLFPMGAVLSRSVSAIMLFQSHLSLVASMSSNTVIFFYQRVPKPSKCFPLCHPGCSFTFYLAGNNQFFSSRLVTPTSRSRQVKVSVSGSNPLKPSDTIWSHFKCSALYRPNIPFVISDIRAFWRSGLSARVRECQKLKTLG